MGKDKNRGNGFLTLYPSTWNSLGMFASGSPYWSVFDIPVCVCSLLPREYVCGNIPSQTYYRRSVLLPLLLYLFEISAIELPNPLGERLPNESFFRIQLIRGYIFVVAYLMPGITS